MVKRVTRGDYLSLLLTQIIIESVGMWSALSFLKVKWKKKKANTSSRREGQNLMICPWLPGLIVYAFSETITVTQEHFSIKISYLQFRKALHSSAHMI